MSALEKATKGWPAGLPDWVQTLAIACDASSQNKVAKGVGYSAATISLVLSGSYGGDLRRVERAVRGAYLTATVTCPVFGAIPTNDCLTHQQQDFRATNHVRVQLYRACHGGCRHANASQVNRGQGV